MKKPLLVGVLFLLVGVGAFAYEGVTYSSRSANALPLSPLLGGLALAAGIVLVIIGARKRPSF